MNVRIRWTVAVVLGELVGFLAPSLVGASLMGMHASQSTLIIGLVIAGSIEGAVLGVFQTRVLRRLLPTLVAADWIRATALAAAVAWLAGMGVSALVEPLGAWVIVIAVPALAVAVPAMGYLQWLVLRRSIPNSFRWVPVTTVAWLIGVMIPVAALSAIPEGWAGWAHVVVGVVAALLMGVTVGLITGGTLERLVRRPAGIDQPWPDRPPLART